MQVRFADSAQQDLLETLFFLRAPSTLGDEFNLLISFVTDYLREWPYTGHRRRDLTKRDVCFWFERPYLFVLQIADQALTIVAVLHSARDVSRILKRRLANQE